MGVAGGRTRFPGTPTEKIPSLPHPWRQFPGKGTERCQRGKQPRKLGMGGGRGECWEVSEVRGKKYYKIGSEGLLRGIGAAAKKREEEQKHHTKAVWKKKSVLFPPAQSSI